MPKKPITKVIDWLKNDILKGNEYAAFASVTIKDVEWAIAELTSVDARGQLDPTAKRKRAKKKAAR